MFRLEAILLLAVLSVVNAANIYTVNIYDNDGEDNTAVEEEFQDERGCNNKLCNQVCRLLNFPGGMCVNGRCKCNNMNQADDIEETIYSERSLQKARSCNNQACDQLCRILNFPGGMCVAGRCKCNNMIQADDLVLKKVKDLDSCSWKACDQLCRRLGFPGGVCVGDSCKCDNFLLINNKNLVKVYEISVNEKENANECHNGDCVHFCQKLGLPGGYCYQDKCICYKEETKKEAYNTFQACDVVACNEICHRLNYIGGMCRHGSCYCY